MKCVACGEHYHYTEKHECSKRVDAGYKAAGTRAEESIERPPSYHERLKDGFNALCDDEIVYPWEGEGRQ